MQDANPSLGRSTLIPSGSQLAPAERRSTPSSRQSTQTSSRSQASSSQSQRASSSQAPPVPLPVSNRAERHPTPAISPPEPEREFFFRRVGQGVYDPNCCNPERKEHPPATALQRRGREHGCTCSRDSCLCVTRSIYDHQFGMQSVEPTHCCCPPDCDCGNGDEERGNDENDRVVQQTQVTYGNWPQHGYTTYTLPYYTYVSRSPGAGAYHYGPPYSG